MQLPQGWADTGALHTAGGDTSPPHNSWQPGQRRPPSCRRRSTRSGDGRRHHRRSCLLCSCSSCYCGEGGSSAAAGSARGAGSGGVGNQWGPMRGHLHLQPLRVSPCLRLYSGSGTQRTAARRGHDSARLRRGQQRPPQRRRSRSPGPVGQPWGAGALVCIYTMHARGSSYHQSSRLGEDGEAGAEGGGRWGGGGALCRSRLGRRAVQSSSNSVRSGRVAQRGTPGRAGCGLERGLKPSPPPGSGTMVGGERYAGGSAPSELRLSTRSLSPGCQGGGFPTPGNFRGEH